MSVPLLVLLGLVGVASVLLLVRAVRSARDKKVGRAIAGTLGAFAGAFFIRLTYWTTKLPMLRGSAWSVKDAAVRAGALFSGLVLLWVGLSVVVPWIFDIVEKRAFSLFVAIRHVRSQKAGSLSLISVLSISGVAIASFVLCGATSVMGGFTADLKRKILGNNAHVVVDQTTLAPYEGGEELVERIRKAPHVVGASPVIYGEVMITSNSNLAGVVVRGIEPKTIGSVIDLPQNIEVGKLDYLASPDLLLHLPEKEIIGLGPGGEPYTKGPDSFVFEYDPITKEKLPPPPLRPGIIVGRELAKTLHVYVGDEVTLISPLGDLGPMGVMPKTKRFRVAAVFFSGMYEYDASHVYTTLESAREYFGMPGKVSAIDVKLDDPELDNFDLAAFEQVVARPELRVRDWRGINKNLFSALKVEKLVVFLVLTLMTLVASFCIICTLLLLVTEKTKDIAVLKALGASDGMILRTFILEGVVVGILGTFLGVSSATASFKGLEWFGVRLDPDVYYIDRLPVAVNPSDFLLVAISATVICTLATVYPALAASSIRPVDGLRFE